MLVIGIDLSGPVNVRDTAVAIFRETTFGLEWIDGFPGETIYQEELTDVKLLSIIEDCCQKHDGSEPIVIGIDAPLSYNQKGGDRPADKYLRQFITEQGMKSGSIMAPTFQRMVYLTLRGIHLSRMIQMYIDQRQLPIRLCEVHPGAALILRQYFDVRPNVLDYKKDELAYEKLRSSLTNIGLHDVPYDWFQNISHRLDACGAALAAWHWINGRSMWCYPADRTQGHLYDVVI